MSKTNEKAIDLEKFCYRGLEPERQKLCQPFSIGEWTYATNGHVAVRVPRRTDIAENPAAPTKEATTLFEEGTKRARYKPAPKSELPPLETCEWEETLTCLQCNGTGKQHQCPDCSCECGECNGTGEVIFIRWHETTIGRACFNSKYIAWLQELPNLALGQPHKHAPLPFRFEGGEGLLMPCKPRGSA
jgi:hypothetical protein